jgi:hypothetical protein
LAQRDECLGHLAPALVRHADHRRFNHRRMGQQRLLDLDRRDVFAAGDDDVLQPVAQLDVPIGVHHGEVARVKPAAAESPLRGVGIAVVPGHHVVSAHDDLAHARAVRGDVAHVGVHNAERLCDDRSHALACL